LGDNAEFFSIVYSIVKLSSVDWMKCFVRNFFGFVLSVKYVGDLYDDVFSIFVAVLKHFVSLLALDVKFPGMQKTGRFLVWIARFLVACKFTNFLNGLR